MTTHFGTDEYFDTYGALIQHTSCGLKGLASTLKTTIDPKAVTCKRCLKSAVKLDDLAVSLWGWDAGTRTCADDRAQQVTERNGAA